MNYLENLQTLPLRNVRNFRRIHTNDAPLLNMCVFRLHLMNYLENLQIIPLGNVRHFRRIHKNDAPFLKTCAFGMILTSFGSPDCALGSPGAL